MLSTLPSFPNGTIALYNTKHSYWNVPMLRRYAKTLPHNTKIEIIATKICFSRRILTTCLKLTSIKLSAIENEEQALAVLKIWERRHQKLCNIYILKTSPVRAYRKRARLLAYKLSNRACSFWMDFVSGKSIFFSDEPKDVGEFRLRAKTYNSEYWESK